MNRVPRSELGANEKQSPIEQINPIQFKDIMLNANNAIVLMIDINGIVTYVNQAIEKITGFTRNEIIGEKWLNFIPEQKQADINSIFDKCVKDGVVKYYQNPIVKKDGSIVNINWENSALFGDDGTLVALLAQGTDTAEEDKLKQQLEEIEQQCKDLMDQQSETLAGGLAHEFRNMLTIILGYVELCLGDNSNSDTTKKHLKQVLMAGNRANDIIREVLAFSSNMSKEKQPISLSSVVNNSLKLLKQSIPESIKLNYEFNCSNDQILGNQSQFEQILINLCNNASHAMPENKGKILVEISDYKPKKTNSEDLPKGEHLELTVEDDGEGIDPNNLEKIFNPFFTTKKASKGTGLGLYTVRRFVENCGGKIFVESQKGEGTKFRMIFPKLKAMAIPATVPKNISEKIEVLGGSEHILVVDDEVSISELMKGIFETKGYKVTTCDSAQAAIDLFQENPTLFDCIITDIKMPGLSGLDFIENIRLTNKTIPIIINTGFNDNTTDEIIKNSGVKAVFSKPTEGYIMLTELRSILDEAQNLEKKHCLRFS